MVAAFCVLSVWAGCESNNSQSTAGPQEPSPPPKPLKGSSGNQAPQEDKTVLEAPPRHAERFAAALHGWLKREKTSQTTAAHEVRKNVELHVGHLRRFRRLASEAYTERQHQLFVSTSAGLTEDGRAAIDLLLDVSSHGLDETAYSLEDLRRLLKDYDGAHEELVSLLEADDGLTPHDRALASVAETISLQANESDESAQGRLVSALLSVDLHDELDIKELMSRFEVRMRDAGKIRDRMRRIVIEVDVLVLCGFFQYALDFRHLKVAAPMRAMNRETQYAAPQTFKGQLLSELKAADTRLAETMRSFWPKHPYYERTRAAYKRYQALDSAGTVPNWKVRRKLKKGNSGKGVVLLKKRLAAEGYYDGDLTEDVFDDALEQAVKQFQRTHQLVEDGLVKNGHRLESLTARSLNVGMARRVKTLRLSLQRWRESLSSDEGFYLRVNVPQFEVEVWEEGKLIRMHKVIAGNNKFEVDEATGRKGHLNRTALMDKELRTVVINPVWRVPERIRVYELEQERLEDPEYYEKHGYREKTLPNGTVQVHQVAGKGNALGRVKLLFPNKHAIYMHDTPKKRLFRRLVRPFSHGCMRLHKPIDMAKFLLSRDGTMEPEEVDKVLRTNTERGVQLQSPIPIHVEYNTVTFSDDHDDPIFLNDIYKYDRAYWRGDVPMKRSQRIPVRNPLEVEDALPGSEELAPAKETGTLVPSKPAIEPTTTDGAVPSTPPTKEPAPPVAAPVTPPPVPPVAAPVTPPPAPPVAAPVTPPPAATP